MQNMDVITTARLHLRPFIKSDLDNFFLLSGDPDVMRYIGKPDTKAQAQIRLTQWLAYRSQQGLGAWAVFEQASDRIAGYGFLRTAEQPLAAEIGYGLAKIYWGKGLATELATALLHWGFQSKQLEQIVGYVNPENIASCRVLEKLGMQDCGLVDRYGFSRKYYRIMNDQCFQPAKT